MLTVTNSEYTEVTEARARALDLIAAAHKILEDISPDNRVFLKYFGKVDEALAQLTELTIGIE